ncbi:uncharacterized protein L201_003313 [Kwoniella dendrophila CBS 6074]|uniref:non-specific serine/threonine protein kinase n=1 Tax=Kwoniella dendrophila CBS 6074 TaxID=1295534 RepID=A0AAX4JSI3_9TREE
MSALGGRVNTYGRKKTQIISIHEDISHGICSSSPIRSNVDKVKRPVLQSKLSNDITNLPSTPIPNSKVGKKVIKDIENESSIGKTKLVLQKHQQQTPQSSPEIVFKFERRVNKRKVVIPRSPISSSSPSPTKLHSSTRTKKIPEVVIPLSNRKVKPLGELTKRLEKVIIEDSPSKSKSSITGNPVTNEDTIEGYQVALDELLGVCSSSTIQPFSQFLTATGEELPQYDNIQKVGEASYSEVFGLKIKEEVKYVLKVIPLLSPPSTMTDETNDKPLPDCSKIGDVKKEIEVTKRMAQVPQGGFVEYIGSYVVEGNYPEKLLEEWDEFKGNEGSASVRPSALPPTQRYCLLLLSHAGVDLETFKFSQTQGWLQAAGIFWQLTSSLARAEKWTQFEHRDLHEGQILIHPYSNISSTSSTKKDQQNDEKDNYLDPLDSGLQTTIIDFGLSRLALPNQSESIWTEVPEEVYEGKGLQWDLYRSMKDKIEDRQKSNGWKGFNPITNVMWLHYILRYMTTKLGQPKAPNRRSSKAVAICEKEEKCILMLNQIEKILGWSIGFENVSKRRGLRGDIIEQFLENKLVSSQDVLAWGEKEKWVK